MSATAQPLPDPSAAARAALAPMAQAMSDARPVVLVATDPEPLHELRIAIRQTRTILRELGHLLPQPRAAAARDLFATLAAATSEPRDLDVYLADWDRHLDPVAPELRPDLEPIRAALEVHRDRAHRELRLVLESETTIRDLDTWLAWVGPPTRRRSDLAPIAGAVGARVARLHHRLVRDGRRISPSSPAADLHALRKRGKRLRYLVDGFAPLYSPKHRRAFLTQLKDLQDNLGAHQDAEVQSTYLRTLAIEVNDGSVGATDTLLAVGRLCAAAEDRRLAERTAFGERFAAFDRPRTATLLDRLLTSATTHP